MSRSLRYWLLAALLWLPQAHAVPTKSDGRSSLQIISTVDLPVEARNTLRVIKQNGPFPYSRDGVVFKNFERKLPNRPRGYYHEYTVKTPGVRNRGARRIVCGPLPECYYTADHYQTFKSIRESP